MIAAFFAAWAFSGIISLRSWWVEDDEVATFGLIVASAVVGPVGFLLKAVSK